MLTAVPDRSGRLSHGVLVDASIHARLLGLRLLTLDATLVLAPADVTSGVGLAAGGPDRAPAHRLSRSPIVSPRRSGAAGRGLAEAVRSLDEGAELLAEARRNGA